MGIGNTSKTVKNNNKLKLLIEILKLSKTIDIIPKPNKAICINIKNQCSTFWNIIWIISFIERRPSNAKCIVFKVKLVIIQIYGKAK